jgi:hypothetical protein
LIWTSCASPNSIPENSLEQPGFACKREFKSENQKIKTGVAEMWTTNQMVLVHRIGFHSFFFLQILFFFLTTLGFCVNDLQS